jgi:hypothetical protein
MSDDKKSAADLMQQTLDMLERADMSAPRRQSPMLYYKKKHMNLLQWAEYLHVDPNVLQERYDKVMKNPGRYMTPQGQERIPEPFSRKSHFVRVLGTGMPPTEQEVFRRQLRKGLVQVWKNGEQEYVKVRPLHAKRDNATRSRNRVAVTHRGETHSLHAWSKKLGIPYQTIYTRYKAIVRACEANVVKPFSRPSHAADLLREFKPRAVRLVELGRTEALPRFVRPVEDCYDSPYHDLTDAEFYKLQAHAKAMGVHMTVIRELMRDATKHKEILDGLRAEGE